MCGFFMFYLKYNKIDTVSNLALFQTKLIIQCENESAIFLLNFATGICMYILFGGRTI